MTIISQQQRRGYGQLALAVFALLAGCYLLTTGGHTSSKDEELLFGVTETLVVWKSVALNAARPDVAPIYSPYGPGQPVLAMPLYALGRALAALFPHDAYPWVTRAVTLWLNPLVVAATAALLAFSALLLGYTRRVALGVTFLYAFATFAWSYSKTFFAEPLTALLLFASFTVALYEQHTTAEPSAEPSAPAPRTLILLAVSGLLATLSLPVKIHGVLGVPFLALYAVAGGAHHRLLSRATLVRALAWGLGASVPIAALALYQWYLFGNPLSTGYGKGAWNHFNPKYFAYRLSGLVWSAGRGFIWYAPPLMLLPLGVWLFWKRHWRVAALCVAITAAHLVFYGLLLYWHGGGSWGPRYLTIALPFMVLPLAAFLHTLRGWRTPWRTAALVTTLLLAVPVQVGGVAIANEAFFSTRRNVHRDHFDPSDSAIAGHLGLVYRNLSEYYHLYLAPQSVALAGGFSYSESDRDAGEQVPRWTLPHATIRLRPPAAHTLHLTLALDGCRHPTLPPAEVTLDTNATPRLDVSPCPPRVYHLLLPPQSATVHLEAPPWNPSSVGIERDEVLGVWLADVAARADGAPLTLQGDLIPITPMPTGYVSIRRWTGDHRLNQWDFWWWYVFYSDLPAGPLAVLVGGWLALALGLLAWGGWQLWKRPPPC